MLVGARRRARRVVPGALDQRLREQPELRHRVRRARGLLEGRQARHDSGRSAWEIAASLNQKLASIQDAYIAVFPPPAVQGLGPDRRLQGADRGSRRPRLRDALRGDAEDRRARRERSPSSRTCSRASRSTRRRCARTSIATRRRRRACAHGLVRDDAGLSRLALRERLQPLRPHLPGERAGGHAVPARARRHPAPEGAQRARARWCRSARSSRSSRARARASCSATTATRRAEITGGPAPGFSSGQAQAALEKLAAAGAAERPRVRLDRARVSAADRRQHGRSGSSRSCVLLAFLVLAAQYESWSLPLVVILIVPMCQLSAIAGVWLTRRRQQHLHADRTDRARGARVQERDSHRRVRAY